MTPPRCEHADCVHACRRAETARPPCDDPAAHALRLVETTGHAVSEREVGR